MENNVNNSELANYDNLRKLAKKGNDYRTLNGNDVLYLPIQVPQGVSVMNMLQDLFSKYRSLIRWYDSFEQADIDFIDDVCEKILSVLDKYFTGDVIKAYKTFSELMDAYDNIFPNKIVEKDITFYRMRTDYDLKEKEQFYHLPTSMRYKCSSERFSIAGYPCFYLGYSKNDCYAEISKTGSMIGLKLNGGYSPKVFDLTFSKEQEEGSLLKNYLKAYPLIASCYVVLMNSIDTQTAKFREEYVIPQMLTSYLRNKNKYVGICYYSVRNENLDALERGEKDYRNLVLFPNLDSSKEYDLELMNQFHWFRPFSVKQ